MVIFELGSENVIAFRLLRLKRGGDKNLIQITMEELTITEVPFTLGNGSCE